MFGIIRRWRGTKDEANASPSVEFHPDTRIYAIGDIHGCADLLAQLHQAIQADLQHRHCRQSIEVYVGDYVDRGPRSFEVLENLALSTPVCNRRICLMGNHEQILIDFLRDPLVLSSWMSLGGLETLQSYGVRVRLNSARREFNTIQAELQYRLPESHRKFLHQLPLSFSYGSYFFVHAGVRPGVALEQQKAEDLLWIRDGFLDSAKDFGAIVVHGHTPGEAPVVLPNRICIDTGAYATGKLTCMVLEGNDKRFLTATRKGTIVTIAD